MYGPSNAERADRAERALLTYLEGEESRAAAILAGNDEEAGEAVQDLINDLLHLANRRGESPLQRIRGAISSYEAEVADEMELANA